MQPGLETILPLVEKPARYIGGETGAAPPARPGDLRFVLCYPDVYEIGMSHKGFLNLYAALVGVDGVAVERCFAPWSDMAAELRRRGVPLAALESGLPLSAADALGFSFATPLNFTAALMMLELARVPLLAAERGEDNPLVIGGGQAMFNAEPMADFLDAVALGEGDELVVELAEVVRAAKAEGAARAETLRRLGAVEGAYVPSWYEATYDGGLFAGLRRKNASAPARVRKRTPAGAAAVPAAAPIVANVPPIHDRPAVEVARGCVWGCRFCQAGMVTRPARERDADVCLGEAEALTTATGASALSFLALNACDYSALELLLENVRSSRPDVNLSLPAARISSYRGELSAALISQRRSQQTFAPEVGADRLRAAINKDFTNDDVVVAVAAAGRAGCQNVKLYFMVGLPSETDDDAAAIGELIAACRRALRDGLGRWGNLSAAVSPFVPQAHTPFQWLGLAPPEVLARRIALVKKGAPRQVKVEGEVGSRVLEACLARGGRRLGPVILEAYRRGASFDAWRDRYDAGAWEGAFAAAGLDMEAYARRELSLEAPLPWDHVGVGVTKDFLAAEFERAAEGRPTARCEDVACRRCGACDDHVTLRFATPELPPAQAPAPAPHTEKKQRLRFAYGKVGPWRWLSHLELHRLLLAQLRRAGAPLSRSGGFSPKPRLVLAPALPVGVAGAEEYGEVFLYEETAPDDFVARVNEEGPFALARAWGEDVRGPALETSLEGAHYRVAFAPLAASLNMRKEAVRDGVDARLAQGDVVVSSRRGKRDLGDELRLESWSREEASIEFYLAAGAAGALYDVVAQLAGVSPAEARAARVTRTGVVLARADAVGN
jgi:radical SAM family uncharacterized protein/radical SAM-linked protein